MYNTGAMRAEVTRTVRLFWALGLLLISGLLIGACRAQQGAAIQLSALEPLPQRQGEGIVPLRLAVANVISPTGTLENYSALVDYLEKKLGRPVELVQRRTYAETNELIRRGEVDVAFVCTNAYVLGHDTFGMQLLVAPVVDGETTYYSLLVVPAESSARSMADLRGKVFAFTDPLSTTGRLYPTKLVEQLGETPESFFARTFYTYSHDDAMRAVAEGVADGAAVDSLVYDFAVERDPALGERLKVIHRSPPFGIPPVVVGPAVRPQVRAELEEILLRMHEDPEGLAALQALDVDRFVLIDDQSYQSVRELGVGLEEADGP